MKKDSRQKAKNKGQTPKTANNERELKVFRGIALNYLKSLLTESKDFRKKVDEIKSQHDITWQRKNPVTDKEFKELKDTEKYRVIATRGGGRSDKQLREFMNDERYKDLMNKRIDAPSLYNDELFAKLCADFFIPEHLWDGVNSYIYSGRKAYLLGNPIEITTSNKLKMEMQKQLIVPYSVVFLRCDITEQELQQLWKNISDAQKDVNNEFLKSTRQLRSNFDRAVAAYRFYQQGFKGKQLIDKLQKEKYIKAGSVDQSDVGKWRREAQKQIKSLEYWELPNIIFSKKR